MKYMHIKLFPFLLISFFVGLLLLSRTALAMEYRAVSESAAILYDSPSLQYGKKLYIVKRFTPLEVIIRSGEWVRVRDAEGVLSWILQKNMSNDRTVVVIKPQVELLSAAYDDAPVVVIAEKWTAFSLLSVEENGWLRLRHLNGAIVYARASNFWGA